ncbi:uncharacterized protein Z518_09508 [Rhinocladiella mackenziei CBS 650.93]|uniref:Uncharacterized protein n=1 Tax=Rhinocladiella mackenziei CBS 650.93 TaxID=1442369 RepID=A0A0D2IEU2_9EURO|nr:uncharacterized protein Z518_09508 [Rhinocladiella mackenziei CBS 650.93]KIX01781.1 hypothetical protein Z518_09508 [Rhinocladiella mackenziei CBS 650.93]
MSFLGDIVNSIGNDRAPAPPKPPVRPMSANSHRLQADVSKPGLRPDFHAILSPLNGTKRKAEDDVTKLPEKLSKPNTVHGLTSSVHKRTAAPPLNAPKPSNEKTPTVPRPKPETTGSISKDGSTPPVTPTTTTVKVPVKGSYADIMARAKQAQETKAQNQIGMIKHQATNREKVSKFAERRRHEEEKAKAAKEKSSGRTLTGKHDNSRSVSPAKKTDQPRVPKVARPPLHAPASTYKGTMGTVSNRSKQQIRRKKSRYDEYLDTDEEDVSDMDGDGEDEEEDYGSDASSVMEAGAFELDEEERLALKTAKEEDARELALENQLKREKEERRKKLLDLANKRK